MLITYTGLLFLVLMDFLVLITIAVNWRALRYRYLRYAALATTGELARQLANILYIAFPVYASLLVVSSIMQVTFAAFVLIAVAHVTETRLRRWWVAAPVLAGPVIAGIVVNIDMSVTAEWLVGSLPSASLHVGAAFILMTRGRADSQGKGWLLILLLFILATQLTMAGSAGQSGDWFTMSFFINSIVCTLLGLNFAYLAVETVHDETLRAQDEQRRLESRMFQTQKLESLGVLAGGIAHDFNNLLVGVLGNAALAKLDLEEDHPARESVDQIEQSANRARELVSQLLAYSGRGKFHLEYVNLSDLVREMAQLLEASISKKAHIQFDLADDLPLIHVDATQVRQIAMNFITNASDALEGVSGDITVTTGYLASPDALLRGAVVHSSLRQGPCVFLQVRDSGMGLDPSVIQSIFDPFFSTKKTGHGLGLAAVIGIVRSHAGALAVETRQGEGAAFTVAFPVAKRVPQVAAPAQHIGASRASGATQEAAATILVGAQQPGDLSRLARLAHEAGFETLPAVDGAEVIALMRGAQVPFDAVLYAPSETEGDLANVVNTARQSRVGLPLIFVIKDSAKPNNAFDAADHPVHIVDNSCTDAAIGSLLCTLLENRPGLLRA
ncbi:MAG: ATP-binding protein [Candidatus Hydrogenedentales bacterium]